jgi:hypothetical protein
MRSSHGSGSHASIYRSRNLRSSSLRSSSHGRRHGISSHIAALGEQLREQPLGSMIHGSSNHKRCSYEGSSHGGHSRAAVVPEAAAAGAAARRTVIPRIPMTVYNRNSLQLISCKMYRFLIIITNSLCRIVTRFFECKCQKPSRYSSHCYSYFPTRE